MRFLLALIGYLSTATVITAVVGLGYVWQTDQINDEKMFKIVALFHDVDLESFGNDDDAQLEEEVVDEEEPSLKETERLRQLMMLNHDVRIESLKRSQNEFNFMLSQLSKERDRFDEMAKELNQGLEQEKKKASQESVQNVVRDLQSVKPDIAKELLLKFLAGPNSSPEEKQKGLEEVIRLMSAMPVDTLQGILKKFQTPEELAQLHEIHQLMLKGGPREQAITEVLDQLYRN